MKKRTISCFLAVMVLLSAAAPAFAASALFGGEKEAESYEIAEGTRVYKTAFTAANGTKRAEQYIEYRPNAVVRPVAAFGSKVCNYGQFATMANLLASRGQNVVGGINGDFYDVATFQPVGLLMSGGEVRSSDGGLNAFGFYGDGRAVISRPKMAIKGNASGVEFAIASLNKARQAEGIALFTYDFSNNTKTSREGVNVVLKSAGEAGLRFGKTAEFTVVSVERTAAPVTLTEGTYVLSADGRDEACSALLSSFAKGERVSVSLSGADEWQGVTEAVGCLYKLVTGGALDASVPALNKEPHPRSAMGIRADGSVILYTVDGRQPASAGATMEQVASRLIELGCVEAGMLDGGGSTNLTARDVGDEFFTQINSPSDGSPRAVTNYIMLASSGEATGQASRLALNPRKATVFVGTVMKLTAKAADKFGRPAPLPAGCEIKADGPAIEQTESGALRALAPGGGRLTLSAPGLKSAVCEITVVEKPDSMTVFNRETGARVSAIELFFGESAGLAVSATYAGKLLNVENESFVWEMTGDAATLENGRVTAGSRAGGGRLLVRGGGLTVEIPVTVRDSWVNPYRDLAPDSPHYESVKYVTNAGLYFGMERDYFGLDEEMTRAMFVTVTGRQAGVKADGGVYSPELAFSDVPLGRWFSEYVAWAQYNGVVGGYGDGSFGPEDRLTREQMCVLVANYLKNIHALNMAGRAKPLPFADAGKISPWARPYAEPVSGMGFLSIFDGQSEMRPQQNITRAEAAQIMMEVNRFMNEQGALTPSAVGALRAAENADQLVIVTAKDSSATAGTLAMYERDLNGIFQEVVRVEANLGKNGLYKTAEGDGKTPAGIFPLGVRFGTRLPSSRPAQYITVGEDDYWVTDSKSALYNRLVTLGEVAKDWDSAERLASYGDAYAFAVEIAFNPGNVPGRGSAVFLHAGQPGRATEGCVSVDIAAMESIINRLYGKTKIIICEEKDLSGY